MRQNNYLNYLTLLEIATVYIYIRLQTTNIIFEIIAVVYEIVPCYVESICCQDEHATITSL